MSITQAYMLLIKNKHFRKTNTRWLYWSLIFKTPHTTDWVSVKFGVISKSDLSYCCMLDTRFRYFTLPYFEIKSWILKGSILLFSKCKWSLKILNMKFLWQYFTSTWHWPETMIFKFSYCSDYFFKKTQNLDDNSTDVTWTIQFPPKQGDTKM